MMGMKNNQIIAIVLIIVLVWFFMNWNNNKENFTICGNPKKWGDQWYYSNQYHQVTPSIVNYDTSNYKFPKSSLNLMKEESQKKRVMVESQNTQLETGLPPMPHNTHSEQTSQYGGNENINEVGAPLDNVLRYEADGMKPYIPTHITNQFEDTNQILVYGAGSEMMDQQSQESVLKELPKPENDMMENNQEMLEELPEMKMKKPTEESIEHEMEMSPEEDQTPMILKINQVDYNMSMSILLTVILIGFVYMTRDY